MKVSTNITIQAPLERVFDVFTDLAKATERIEGIINVEIIEGSPQLAVGTKWKETRVMFGKEASETMWVTELAPQASYTVCAASHGTEYTSVYTFEATSEGVVVTMVFEGKPVTLGAKILGVIFFFMTGSMKKMLHQDMEDLKKVCEEDASPEESSS